MKPGASYPSPSHPVSYSGPPQAFSHVQKIGPEFNDAASGSREKRATDALRPHAPDLKKDFSKAHEGPREEVGKPTLHHILIPSGEVVAAVHAQHDREKLQRNQEKDRQMKAWREAAITTSRTFNTRALAPMHLRETVTPEVFLKAARQAALKRRLQQKQEQAHEDHER
ncbi:hypothetical protein Pla108_27050 [Botrimarina colliarenosi]|uniref:Uncharacterized protein n=1 Tax=Botrimarina colliarenosi TaxID=2528001 RepID=A0A5C6ABG1_9BACT|nr:hypothetical protein [Botrimarina colliarenosi]TWT96929.1 hypothetical protein Pla108_27050 [Botrimarina colliarenosi]